MLDLYKLPEGQILLFALVLMRMTAFVISSAIFGSPSVSVKLKVLLSILLAIMIFPSVRPGADYATISADIILLTGREVLIGLTLGFLTRLFFFAVTMTGDLVSISAGLNASQLYNPVLGQNGNTLEQFYTVIGTLVFLCLNGHHIILASLTQSFDFIPVSSLHLNVGVFGELATFGQGILMMCIKMSAPVIVAVLMTNVAMGVLGRAVPQINVLVTSMPVTISIGMGVVFICLPLLIIEMTGIMDSTAGTLFAVIKHL